MSPDILDRQIKELRIDLTAQLSVLDINQILIELIKNTSSSWCKIGGKMAHDTKINHFQTLTIIINTKPSYGCQKGYEEQK